MAIRDVRLNIIGKDAASATFNKVAKNLQKFSAQTSKLSGALGNIGSLTAPIAGIFGGVFAALGAGAKSVIDTAETFETLGATLEAIEHSSEKAKAGLAWVAEFSKTTPFELAEVSDAFVQLRARGFDPMADGLLKSLGDVASAMGQPLADVADAFAAATTGENERLKRLGITAKIQGEKVVYQYSQNGKQMLAAADKNDRAMIQSTLMAIWNPMFAGAMDKRSATFGGMWSNFMDQIAAFKLRIANSGLFDGIKVQLAGLLKKFDEWGASGKLDEWAKMIGDGLTVAFNELVAAAGKFDLTKAIQSMKDFVGFGKELYDMLGGLEGIATKAATVFGVMLVSNLATAGLALFEIAKIMKTTAAAQWILNAAMAANPAVIAFVAITAALAGVIALLKQATENWELFKSVWSDTGKNFKEFWFGADSEGDAPSKDGKKKKTGGLGGRAAPAFAGFGPELSGGVFTPMVANAGAAVPPTASIEITGKLPDWMQIKVTDSKKLDFVGARGGIVTP